jgi:FkbM family methyltransferase
MRYRIKLFAEIIYRLRGYTAADNIRLLLLLPFITIVSFTARRIYSIRKAILRKYRSIELLDLLGRLIKSTYLKVIISKRTVLLIRSNNLQEDFSIATLLHEPFVAKIFKPDPGDVIIDVGAHIGSYTIRCAKAVGEKGIVIAFEPDPENFKVLLLNVKMNNLKNVIAFPYAVGKSNGIIKLHKSKFTGLHSTVKFPQGYIGSIKVKAITLDALTENIGVKKID